MLTIVGGGPGVPGALTEAAVEALDRAEAIFLEPTVRQVLDERREWMAKVESAPWGRIHESGLAQFAEREAVWLVPDSPSVYAPVRQVLEQLGVSDIQYVRVISGVPTAVFDLDQQGLFLPAHQIDLSNLAGHKLLHWQEGQWDGDWLKQKVSWQEARPLFGRRIVLLRRGGPALRAQRWLGDWGASVEVCPVSRIAEPPSYDPVDAVIRHVERYDWVIFTSSEAVGRWFDRLKRLGEDMRRMRARIAVVGPETAVRIRERGLVPDLMPDSEFSQEGLAEAFRAVPMRGHTVLFPGGQLNSQVLGEDLRGRGALVDELLIYQNLPVPLSLSLHHAIRSGTVDAILYTASSQVEYLMDQLPVEDRRHLARIPSFSIGPLTTRTLRHYGIQPAAESVEPSLRLLAETVRDYYARHDGA